QYTQQAQHDQPQACDVRLCHQCKAPQAKPGRHECSTKDIVEAEERYSCCTRGTYNNHAYIGQGCHKGHSESYGPIELVDTMTLEILAQDHSGEETRHDDVNDRVNK